MSSNRKRKNRSDRLNTNLKKRNRIREKRKNLTSNEKLIDNLKSKKRMCMNRESKKKKAELDTSAIRVSNFRRSVRYGPIFPCCSCEQMMFENGVVKLNDELWKSIESKCESREPGLLSKVFEDKLRSNTYEVSVSADSSYFICFTCKKHLKNGKMPPMAAANGLKVLPIPKEIELTELENNLISRRILFKKIYQLPKSRIAAMKDKIVNVPIREDDIASTLQSLPRTPTEGGLVEVKLKRKLEYKNHHRHEYVNPSKLFSAISYLKAAGNPFYQNIDSFEEFKSRCAIDDPEGFDTFFDNEKLLQVVTPNFGPNRCSVIYVSDTDDSWEEVMELRDYLLQLESEAAENEEMEYRQYDPIRKHQIDYDKSVCLSEKYPEAFHIEKELSTTFGQLSVAPGESKVPENILFSENWDAQAFPLKHPDGKHYLHHQRDVRLSDQYYFVQRLRNIDGRFRNDPSYLFAAASFLEKKMLQRNVNVSFLRGKKKTSNSGQNVYSLEDGFSVFDNASNTPTYWKKAKYEMMAKLDNNGPFQFFFTLSCADRLWTENLTTILEERNLKLSYECDSNGESIFVGVDKDNCTEWFSLTEYLENEIDESFHEILRRNVVIATRNYNHRVKSFIREIMMAPSNPMSIEYYSSKLEFQGRGAAHNHGTLWVNMDKMEFMIEECNDNRSSNPIEYNIKHIESLFDKSEKHFLEEVKKSIVICKNNVRPKTLIESKEEEVARDIVAKFGREKLQDKSSDVDDILSRFKFKGLTKAFKKFQTQESLSCDEETAVVSFANKFTSVCLNPQVVGKEVVNIVKKVNQHRHTKACKKYQTECRFAFPKFPVWKTLISSPNKTLSDEEKASHEKILTKVGEVLSNQDLIDKIMKEYNKNEESEELFYINREKRIKQLLSVIGYDTEENWNLYIEALSNSKRGYSIILQRDIDEVFVNSVNPEWILAWQGNIDLQICLDFFAVITYITD